MPSLELKFAHHLAAATTRLCASRISASFSAVPARAKVSVLHTGLSSAAWTPQAHFTVTRSTSAVATMAFEKIKVANPVVEMDGKLRRTLIPTL